MIEERHVDDLVDIWQTANARGSAPEIAELCRDCPDLIPQVEERIKILSRLGQLAALVSRDTVSSVHAHQDTVLADKSSEASACSAQPLPDTLGGFVLKRVLGAGGMGTVYLAEDVRLNRHVALKVMKPDLAANSDARQRFLREARAMAAVSHDHIVTVHAVGEEHDVPFLVMPLLKGETLEDRLQRSGKLPLTAACRIAYETLLGLAAAHDVGIVHRDVKPGNLWLEGERDRVKILDFGLTRTAQDDQQLTQSWAALGTPAYMAPEQAAGAVATAQSDLFSFGTVLYRMLTGRHPFLGDNVMATLSNLASRSPEPACSIDPLIPIELSELIDSLLAKTPSQRPPSATSVAERLNHLMADLLQQGTVLVKDVAQSRPRKRALRQMPRLWGGLVCAAVLSAAILLTLETKDGQKTTVRIPTGTDTTIDVPSATKVIIQQEAEPAAITETPGELEFVAAEGVPANWPVTAKRDGRTVTIDARRSEAPQSAISDQRVSYFTFRGKLRTTTVPEKWGNAGLAVYRDDSYYGYAITSDGLLQLSKGDQLLQQVSLPPSANGWYDVDFAFRPQRMRARVGEVELEAEINASPEAREIALSAWNTLAEFQNATLERGGDQ